MVACKDPSNGNVVKPDSDKTVIIFDNRETICDVTVYSSPARDEQSRIVRIPAGEVSSKIEWISGNMVFFFTYHINLKGISSFAIDYMSP